MREGKVLMSAAKTATRPIITTKMIFHPNAHHIGKLI